MNKSIVLHKKTREGIADFIRSGLLLYSFSQIYDFDYYIDFGDYPDLEKCFNIKKYAPLSDNNIHINLINPKEQANFSQVQDLERSINEIVNNLNVYKVVCNFVSPEHLKNILIYKDKYFSEILTPSAVVNDRINNYTKNITFLNIITYLFIFDVEIQSWKKIYM